MKAMPPSASTQDHPKRHLLVAGSGRAGTSLLVEILTACGMDTALARNPHASWDPTACAGYETVPLFEGDHPYVVKSPWSYHFIQQLLDRSDIRLDGVLIPIRRLEEASSSRVIVEMQQMYRRQPALLDLEDLWDTWACTPGGITFSLEPLDLARVLAVSFHKLLTLLVEREVPIYLVSFPRFCTDLGYLYRVLLPILPPTLDEALFREKVAPLIRLDRIRTEEEIRAPEKVDTSAAPEESDFPSLPTLHQSALKREVKRLRADLGTLKEQLERVTAEHDRLESRASGPTAPS